MKAYKLICLLCFLIGTISCKKQIEQSANANDVASNSLSSSSADFSAVNFLIGQPVDNPFLSFVTGTIFYYKNTITEDGEISYEKNYVTVTPEIKKILGVNCTVIHDQIKEDGEVTEDTYDWYAQDKFGNVWYFGEDTRELTDTGWSTEGSWEAGKKHALPGIAMFANPGVHIGQTYYQEFLYSVAEDQAKVLSINSSATVPYGNFNNCLETKEFTRLEPGDIEHKFYAKGVGQVLGTSATERDELISITK